MLSAGNKRAREGDDDPVVDLELMHQEADKAARAASRLTVAAAAAAAAAATTAAVGPLGHMVASVLRDAASEAASSADDASQVAKRRRKTADDAADAIRRARGRQLGSTALGVLSGLAMFPFNFPLRDGIDGQMPRSEFDHQLSELSPDRQKVVEAAREQLRPHVAKWGYHELVRMWFDCDPGDDKYMRPLHSLGLAADEFLLATIQVL